MTYKAKDLKRHPRRIAQVAQLVEQRTENPRVGGSIPPLGTIHLVYTINMSAFYALIGQVTHNQSPYRRIHSCILFRHVYQPVMPSING